MATDICIGLCYYLYKIEDSHYIRESKVFLPHLGAPSSRRLEPIRTMSTLFICL